MAERASPLPERRALKDALRAAGLSDRQVRALFSGGWRALVGESQAIADELREEIDALTKRFGG